jgi:hypothetical protein
MFIGTACGTLLFYSFYQSRYATSLLDKAAAGISSTSRISFGYENIKDSSSVGSDGRSHQEPRQQISEEDSRRKKDTNPEGKEDECRKVYFGSVQPSAPSASHTTQGPTQDQSSSALQDFGSAPGHPPKDPQAQAAGPTHGPAAIHASDRASNEGPGNIVENTNCEPTHGYGEDTRLDVQADDSFHEISSPISLEEEIPGAYLTLYKVSMLVERMFSSTFFDDHWAIGLSEKRLYSAIELLLKNDQALGSQFAIFAFTGVSMSAAGSTLDKASERFSFAVFAVVAAAGFLCGITCSVLSGMLLRQISLTQTKEDGTAHEFSEEFGHYLRMVGGLNSFAGIFIATAVFHFLLSIFQVTPAIALPLGALWIVAGSVLLESFMASFSYWSLKEVFEDLGELVEPPEVNSPSPVTGTLQHIGRWINTRILRRGRNKGD